MLADRPHDEGSDRSRLMPWGNGTDVLVDVERSPAETY